MGNWLTLIERKIIAMDGMRNRIALLCQDLQDYVAANKGQFILFGSAARGTFDLHSDVNIIVDFPAKKEADSCRFAEESCFKHGLKPDVRSILFCNKDFIKCIQTDAVYIHGKSVKTQNYEYTISQMVKLGAMNAFKQSYVCWSL